MYLGSKCRAEAGLSMVELLMALAIVSITLMMGLPLMMQPRVSGHAVSASNQLAASLATARSIARSSGERIIVCPYEGAMRCRNDGVWDVGWLVFVARGDERQPAQTDDILRVVQPAGGASSQRIRSSPSRSLVRFLPDGRAAGTNLTIRICPGDENRVMSEMVVNNFGRVRVKRPRPAVPIPCL